MKTQILIASGIFFAAFVNMTATIPAQAKTEKACIAEWNQMKAAKETAGKKRKDFIAQCRAEGATTAPANTEPKPHPKAGTMAPAPTGRVVFPSGISPKYSKESAGRARMHSCRDQYQANKATGGNGGLKWIQKGGGYYSECNKHLKGG
jgi:hypothetical protein